MGNITFKDTIRQFGFPIIKEIDISQIRNIENIANYIPNTNSEGKNAIAVVLTQNTAIKTEFGLINYTHSFLSTSFWVMRDYGEGQLGVFIGKKNSNWVFILTLTLDIIAAGMLTVQALRLPPEDTPQPHLPSLYGKQDTKIDKTGKITLNIVFPIYLLEEKERIIFGALYSQNGGCVILKNNFASDLSHLTAWEV